MKTKILWLAPNFNHYKALFLNRLAKEVGLNILVLTGTGRSQMGDQELNGAWSFTHYKLNVPKSQFGYSKTVRNQLKQFFKDFDWVLIPAEKKNLGLFIYSLWLRKKHPNVKLFSYNHPVFKSRNGRVTFLDLWLTRWFYKKMDRIIFYTEQSCNWAIAEKLINPDKAFWANNTIDTHEMERHYKFHFPPKENPALLFIGRLIPSKRIGDFIEYFRILKKRIPRLRADVIGDGPDRTIVEQALKKNGDLKWHGALVEESSIAPIMAEASLVFVPGHSGLSVNHSFAYGRPYITLEGPSHAPEIDYIQQGYNGYILPDDLESITQMLFTLLTRSNELERLCKNAFETGRKLSIENWVLQIKQALINE